MRLGMFGERAARKKCPIPGAEKSSGVCVDFPTCKPESHPPQSAGRFAFAVYPVGVYDPHPTLEVPA